MAKEVKNDNVVGEEEVKNQAENLIEDTLKNNSEESTENKSDNSAEESKDTEEITDKKKKSSKKKKVIKLTPIQEKEKENEELRYKMSEINDKYLRLSAEFDNYRKRTLKEKTELIKTAGGAALESMLPIVDDFERALQQMETAADIVAVKEGVMLIYNKFQEFIKAKGIVEIDALNQEFDTDFHEALTKIPAPEESLKGKVVDVIQKGYKIDEKVIRFAKVVIGE
ncbi:MAG: nucleotide exchange factor GrpE [Salinivirgaceae bacterium]|nr:nucleotide exchange factor GrpE [Salinivirgaceae bacterium]